ncbi:hypothetical protein FDP41_001789 [Naegleria fowleri]|uniref:Uncharacterized protein n=1 Tax=Naegleria fowleri TaxID=5763 RepID=A0A6A5BVX8_NAEFO|nr:uncharacterized protein FDP41_001789 [Naegleria fowleri]KAF0979446.1 hypothetical protein FDP41_001789 [Naegleria fowleri]CAG4710993.1 unnamed protein product [Naegleria fowleri]
MSSFICNSIQENPPNSSSLINNNTKRLNDNLPSCPLVENVQSDPRRALPEGIEMGKESMSGNCNKDSDVDALIGFKESDPRNFENSEWMRQPQEERTTRI